MKHKVRIMLLLNASRQYSRALLAGIARYSKVKGEWSFMRPPPFWKAGKADSVFELARQAKPDGIIMGEQADMQKILSLGIPTVVSNYYSRQIDGPVNIVTDHQAVGRMAAEHLMACAFTQFAYCGYENMFWSSDRQDGFQSLLADNGHEAIVYEPGKRPARDDETALTRWIEHLPKPIGMMACIDERSQQIIEICRKLDIDVPGQMGIVGVDNDPLICELSSRPLSSVNISAERAGYEAAERLAGMISRRRASRKPVVIHPTYVTQRFSTDIVNVEDTALREAVRFIRERAREPVDVDAVVQRSGVSRRSLERRFQSELGRSIYRQIRRVRVACIKTYLVDTSLGIFEIARELGFPHVEHFARYFRAETGESPAAFRKRMARK